MPLLHGLAGKISAITQILRNTSEMRQFLKDACFRRTFMMHAPGSDRILIFVFNPDLQI